VVEAPYQYGDSSDVSENVYSDSCWKVEPKKVLEEEVLCSVEGSGDIVWK
jgi:hypothetical protein